MRDRFNRGFTIIEMVVVLTVIGILTSFAVVNYQKVRDKSEAARVATQLHYIEDAIAEAILDGATLGDFTPTIRADDVDGSVLGPYLTSANLADVPEGMTLQATGVQHRGEPGFNVMVVIRADDSHLGVMRELALMFPSTLEGTVSGGFEYLQVDSRTLAPREAVTPASGTVPPDAD